MAYVKDARVAANYALSTASSLRPELKVVELTPTFALKKSAHVMEL